MKNKITGAVARGWIHPENSSKEMDTELGEAIVQEVEQVFQEALDQKDEQAKKEKLEILDGLDAICEQHWDKHKMEVHLSVLRDFVEEQKKFITKNND